MHVSDFHSPLALKVCLGTADKKKLSRRCETNPDYKVIHSAIQSLY
jgi:hypothetical protein